MDTKTLPVFELQISEEDSAQGVFATSLVEYPAIQANFIALNEETYKLNADSQKQILTGPFIIPNRYIYRINAMGEEYYVYLSSETIEKIQQKFFKNDFQTKTTHQHLVPLTGNTVVESWIIEDPENDKANALGFKLPKGTWMISVKINDKEYWDSQILTSKVKGFSLEGTFEEVPKGEYTGEVQSTVQFKNQNDKMSKKVETEESKALSFYQSCKKALGFNVSEVAPAKVEKAEKFGTFYLPDGQVIEVDETMKHPVMDAEGNEIGVMTIELTPEAVESPDDVIEPVADPSMVTTSEMSEVTNLSVQLAEMRKAFETLSNEMKVIKAGTVKPVHVKKDFDPIPSDVKVVEPTSLSTVIANRKKNK